MHVDLCDTYLCKLNWSVVLTTLVCNSLLAPVTRFLVGRPCLNTLQRQSRLTRETNGKVMSCMDLAARLIPIAKILGIDP